MESLKRELTRRRFVGALGAIGIGGAGVGLYQATGTPTLLDASAGDDAAADHATDHASEDADDVIDHEAMDRAHEENMMAFPAETEARGGQPLEYEMDGNVKVFEITCEKGEWEVEPGKVVEAWMYNGMVPGPEIRVTEGDKVRIHVHNEMDESTTVHWHGLRVPIEQDGVPFISQPPIKPGETFTYEFVAKPAGTHMYHPHYNSAKQSSYGLSGAFIVEPKDPSTRPQFDREATILLNDGKLGYTINGKGYPATEPVICKLGERVLVRYINVGVMYHPMHLHGLYQEVIAKDGHLLPNPYLCDNINIAPGDRWEVIVEADEPGTWVWHCHILPHAENEHGMFGMVTAMIVEE